MRAIVVGGSGFLGDAIVRQLVARGDEVVVLDRHLRHDHRAIDVEVVRADIADLEGLTRAFRGGDEVYHLAGRLGTTELEHELRAAVDVNVVGTLNVFDAVVAAGVPTVFLACKPNVWLNAYTITKEAAEGFARLYARDHDLRVRCLRYFNVFGPGQALLPVRKMIPTFAVHALRGRPIPIFGDGLQTVDLMYVDDLATTTLDFVRAEVVSDATLECGRGEPLTVMEVAHMVDAHFGGTSGVACLPMRVGETPHTSLWADIGPLEEVVGPLRTTDLATSLAHTLDWYADRSPGEIDRALAALATTP